MFQDFFLNLSFSLNSLPVISIWLFQIIFCYLSILFALKFFGKVGIYVYVSIAIILANIQVLKVVEFPFFPEPMALGTILFISIFLCTDILNEYYDKKSATKCIYMGISAYLFSTILMFLTISFNPIDPSIHQNWGGAMKCINLLQQFFYLSSQLLLLVSVLFSKSKIRYFYFSYLKNKDIVTLAKKQCIHYHFSIY